MPKIIKNETDVYFGTLYLKRDGDFLQISFDNDKIGDDVIILLVHHTVDLDDILPEAAVARAFITGVVALNIAVINIRRLLAG